MAVGSRFIRSDRLTAAFPYPSANLRIHQVYGPQRARAFAAGVANADEAVKAIGEAAGSFGALDLLDNNSAVRKHTSLDEVTPKEWQRIVSVNLIGVSNYCKAALPLLRRSSCGSIVNVSSCYAVTGRKGMGTYDATKAGILSMTRTLAFEEAAAGVRVNAVCPGSTLTEFHIRRAEEAGTSIHALKTQRRDRAAKKLGGRNTLILKIISLRRATEADMKTIAGLSTVAFLLGSVLAGAQSQQNMGTPRMGTGMGEAGPSFHPPSRSGRLTPRPPATEAIGGSPPPQWSTFQTAPGLRNWMARRKIR
jgi:NAD(P)-dependent dehydrogenase (short-subunit alcohol dehydrogenase family)